MIAWHAMMEDEDAKLAKMESLLQQVSYWPVFNRPRYDSLYEDLKKLYEMRYDPETMTDEQINAYDSATDHLIVEIKDFARDHPDFEKYPVADSLISEIDEAQQRVLFHRSRYDNYVKDFNYWLEYNQDYLYDLDTAGTFNLDKRPLFQLPADEI